MEAQVTLKDLREQLERVERIATIGAKSVLNLDEAVVFTGFSRGHLYRLTSEKMIPHYKKGRKLFFRKSELETWLLGEKVLTRDDVDSMADTYIARRR